MSNAYQRILSEPIPKRTEDLVLELAEAVVVAAMFARDMRRARELLDRTEPDWHSVEEHLTAALTALSEAGATGRPYHAFGGECNCQSGGRRDDKPLNDEVESVNSHFGPDHGDRRFARHWS